MTIHTVTTQQQLDALTRAGEYDEVVINSEAGVWLEVRASGSATVSASSHVAVHLHSARVSLTGGVTIDHTSTDLTDSTTWCAYTGAEVDGDHVTLYKAVDRNWASGYGFTYTPGTTVTAPDWRDTDECGYGLHFGSTPGHADAYYNGEPGTARYLAVRVPLAGLRPITGGGTPKCKTQSCEVLHEVDIHGRAITAAVTR